MLIECIRVVQNREGCIKLFLLTCLSYLSKRQFSHIFTARKFRGKLTELFSFGGKRWNQISGGAATSGRTFFQTGKKAESLSAGTVDAKTFHTRLLPTGEENLIRRTATTHW